MDFFHALDAGRYGAFKTSMLNGWAAGAFDPPDTVNKIYRTAGTWVKPVPRGEGGTAVSYVTIKKVLNKQQPRRNRSNSENKNNNKQQQPQRKAR